MGKTGNLAFAVCRTSGQQRIFPTARLKFGGKKFQMGDKGWEYQHLMPLAQQSFIRFQHLVHLPGTSRIFRKNHTGMIGKLPKTGDAVEGDNFVPMPFFKQRVTQRVFLFRINILLLFRHSAINHLFHQRWQFGCNLRFGTAKKKRTDHLLQLLPSAVVAFFYNRMDEMVPEIRQRSQQTGVDEVKLGP